MTPAPLLRAASLAGLLVASACSRPVVESRPERDPRAVGYAGAATCAECHAGEYRAWSGSHHDLAMQEATPETVLGDFDDASIEVDGVTTRFFVRDGKYFVHTSGPAGEEADFEVAYVFGVEPLQQVLLRMPGGRFQCLTIAWDTVAGRWYDLYPREEFEPDDELHWTGVYQNWNAMCADCHSTRLRKGYDPVADTYATTFSEIDVACEACHGPGEEHVAWARQGSGSERPSGDAYAKGLVTQLRRGEPVAQLNACAPCHSRRTLMTADPAPGGDFHSDYLLSRLNEGTYHDDGQILDEVYVFGSFLQSKMHQRGVGCTDCHDPHSLELWLPGNGLCLQCHSEEPPLDRFPTLVAKNYDSPAHHFHAQDSEGARCVECHMIERNYMVVDPRRDHSFRIPRPDLSTVLGTPNACTDCHADQTAAWAAEAVDTWYGADRERQPSVAPLFLRARLGDGSVAPQLAGVAVDPEQPGIIRATAIDYLQAARAQGWSVMVNLLDDPDVLVRQAAVGGLEEAPAQLLSQIVVHSLHDEARTVRIEAARALAAVKLDSLDEAFRAAFERALAEFEQAQAFSADFPWSHLNLALVRQARGDTKAAIASYRRALELDARFAPARFNLANLLNTTGRNAEAIEVLQGGVRFAPDSGDLYYSLGLALAEEGRAGDAAEALFKAATFMPDRPRVHYNAGLALQQAGRLGDAEAELVQALRLTPKDPEVIHALALLYIQLEAWSLAREHAVMLDGLFPDAPWVAELHGQIATAEGR